MPNGQITTLPLLANKVIVAAFPAATYWHGSVQGWTRVLTTTVLTTLVNWPCIARTLRVKCSCAY